MLHDGKGTNESTLGIFAISRLDSGIAGHRTDAMGMAQPIHEHTSDGITVADPDINLHRDSDRYSSADPYADARTYRADSAAFSHAYHIDNSYGNGDAHDDANCIGSRC